MDMKSIDLNLLVVFEAMIDHRSVSRAADSIGLSQPAMSAAVARLRTLLDDPLFVRTGAEMKPTPRAQELAEPVRRVIDTIRTEVLQRSGFDPGSTERAFTILTPDIGEVNFLPKLLTRFSQVAPAALLRTLAKPRQAAAEALEAGTADLALGYFPDLQKAGFFQQKLFDNPHVCLVRNGHPTVAGRMTLKEYLAASHAVVRPDGREHVFEHFIQQRGLRRKIAVELSHFMSLLSVLESTDLIATVPRDFADVCRRYVDVRILETPLKSPVIAVHQFWHRRFHKDPANVWLRGVISSLFTSATEPDRPAASAEPGKKAPARGRK